MSFKHPLKKVLLFAIIAWSIALLQYLVTNNKHLRLKHHGIVVPAQAVYSKEFAGEFARFSFITKEGLKIEHKQKCGNREMFDREYSNMFVIYNSKDPHEFQTLYQYTHYSVKFFYFLVYPLLLTGFLLLLTFILKRFYFLYKKSIGAKDHR